MANKTQLNILKQSVPAWNEWRKTHIDEKIDLREAHLSGADLREADLRGALLVTANLGEADLGFDSLSLVGANLRGANLRGANLDKATLIGADLSRATLIGATLIEATLGGATLYRTNLNKAFLHKADLSKAFLHKANLSKADLSEAHLDEAELSGARLVRTNLSKALLYKADLTIAILEGANLEGAILEDANIDGAALNGANLKNADLVGARLMRTNLSKATITGAKLYGTARDDWKIDGIQCDYVFWDLEGKKRTPENRDFNPGEFETLYKQLPTFEYVFEHGFTALDAVVMSRIVDTINAQHVEFKLDLVSFDKRGQPHATFTVLYKEYVEEVRKQVAAEYESQIKVLEGQRDLLMKVIDMQVTKMLESGGITIQSSVGGNVLIQQAQAIEAGHIVAGNQDQRSITAGRDYHERIGGNAQVTTGDSQIEEHKADNTN